MLSNVPQLAYFQCLLLLWFMHSVAIVYIGPNALTISDFIQMIWDQKAPVVVMLTHLFEKGKVAKYTIFSDTAMSINEKMVEWLGVIWFQFSAFQ